MARETPDIDLVDPFRGFDLYRDQRSWFRQDQIDFRSLCCLIMSESEVFAQIFIEPVNFTDHEMLEGTPESGRAWKQVLVKRSIHGPLDSEIEKIKLRMFELCFSH